MIVAVAVAISIRNATVKATYLYLLEGGERSKDRSSNPDGVFPLGRSNDLDLHGGRSKGGDFLLHPVGDSCRPVMLIVAISFRQFAHQKQRITSKFSQKMTYNFF